MPKLIESVYSGFTVQRVKDVYFSLNDELLIDFNANQIVFELGQTLGANEDRRLVNLTIRVFFHYVESEEIIADIKVQNIFFLPDLNKYINGNTLSLPSDIIVSMVSVGIAHTRALLAKNLAGTPLDETLLPVFNPLSLAQEFFPNLFSDKETSESQKPKKKSLKK